MRILALTIKDFKGIKDVEIRPDPTLVVITGRNESGKTSCLDAVEAVLCGSKATPQRPVRAGCDKAEVTVDLGDYTVTRRWNPDGSDRLTIRDAQGSTPRSPQTLLDGLYQRVAFDPVSIARMDQKTLARTLRTLAGLEDVFLEIDNQIKQAEEDRTRVNRDVKGDEARVEGYGPESMFVGLPDEEVSAAGLMEQYRDAVNEKSQNDSLRQDVTRCMNALDRATDDRVDSYRRVETLRRQLREAEAEDDRRIELRDKAELALNDAEVLAETLTDPDTTTLQAQIRDAEITNALVRKKRERQTVYDRWLTNRREAVELTGTIESLRAEKAARLSEAKYPVQGLDVRGDSVVWEGVPIEQVSSARKIRLGLAVGSAMHPTLRVALIREASLLDADAFRVVQEWAAENDYQAWCEVVGSSDSTEGIVIEAGTVVADRTKPTPKRATKTPKAKPTLADELHAETVRDANELF